MRKNKVNLVEREMLSRKQKNDDSRKGFNFVGSQYKWTDIDEQKMRVKEIEEKTNENIGK